MLLYLAEINEHAVLRIDGSKRWRRTKLRTIQCLSNTEFASWQLDATVRVVKAHAAGKNGITSCLPNVRSEPFLNQK